MEFLGSVFYCAQWHFSTFAPIPEYQCECVDSPLHRRTYFSTFLPYLSINLLILSLEFCISMFINLYTARPTYHFILIYTCGLTVVIKRICYVKLCCPRPRSAANQPHAAAVVDRRDRQTDGRTDTGPSHRRCSAYDARGVNNALKSSTF